VRRQKSQKKGIKGIKGDKATHTFPPGISRLDDREKRGGKGDLIHTDQNRSDTGSEYEHTVRGKERERERRGRQKPDLDSITQ
jgi:hypothetical protein